MISRVRSTHADIVGVIETKKEFFIQGYLKTLADNTPFSWFSLPAKDTAGGILVGCNSNKFSASVCDILNFSVSLIISDVKTGFCWKLVVVYGSPYETGKLEFLTEIDEVMSKWKGPTMVVGDFSLVRFAIDNSNLIINYR